MSPVSSQPSVRQRLARLLGLREIARHDARAAHVDAADMAIGKRPALVVADLDLVAGQRPAAADEAVDRGPVRAGGDHAQMLRQVIGVDPVDDDAALERREADRERAFGHAVAGQERARIEAGRRQQLGEAVRQLGADGLGADAGDPPRRQVVAGDVLGTNAARAQARSRTAG